MLEIRDRFDRHAAQMSLFTDFAEQEGDAED